MYPLSVGLVLSQPGFSDEAHSAIEELPVRLVMDQPRIENPIDFRDTVDQLRPDVLLLDYSEIANFEGIVELIRATSAAPVVCVVHGSAEPQALLATIRSGAGEFLFPPFGGPLKQALERRAAELEKQHASSQPRGSIIGLVSAKGGCGASTVACHAAVALRRQTGKEVLLIDFDLASPVIRHLTQVQSQYNVLDALQNVQRLDLSYWRGLVSNGPDAVEVLAGPVDVVSDDPARTRNFRQLLRFACTQYDYILVDFGQGTTAAVLEILEDCHQVLLVAAAEIPALRLAQQAVRLLERFGYGRNRVHLVLNQLTREFRIPSKDLEDIVGLPVYASLPADRDGLADAYAMTSLLPQRSPLYRAISKLASKAAGLQPEPGKKRFGFFANRKSE